MSFKKSSESYDDNEEMSSHESSGLMNNNSKDIEIPFCGFLSVKYYQPYFDVDTVDIQNRILQSALYCRREQNFLNFIGDKPDAYGPFWISTTLVFFVSLSSHLNGWFTSWMKGNLWEYDFQSVLTASSMIFGFAFLAPLFIWIIFRQYEPQLKYVSIFCLYGYSLFIYLPAVLICLVPSELAVWLSLLTASIISAIFLLRNLAPIVVAHAQKQAALFLSLVGSIQLVFMIVLKLYFFYEKS